MSTLPYELSFMHKFNLHKLVGLIMDDYNLRDIARIYGVRCGELRRIENGFNRVIDDCAKKLKEKVPPKTAPSAPYKILAFGDSITSDRTSWAKILNRYWEDGSRKIIDCAVSGDTTADLINRLYSTALKEEFEWAVFFIGINDARQPDDGSKMCNISLEEYKKNMEYLVKTFMKRKKKIALVTLAHVDSDRLKKQFPDNNWVYDRYRVDRANDAIRELAKKYKLALVDLAKELRKATEDMLDPDGIHMNSKAQLMLSEMLLGVLP
jgi:lysophospholipase L1-like esterase